MILFYTPDINGKTYTLNDKESKHCIKVLRLKANDLITLTDGKGFFYKTRITLATLPNCTVEIMDTKKIAKRKNYLHIAISSTKNRSRFEWFLEKATEIGVDEITPLICEHSERKTLQYERAEKIIIAAMKQSLKAYLPRLNSPINFNDFVSQNFKGTKYIAHCKTNERQQLKYHYSKNKDALILIGPEGDFSQVEIELAQQHSFTEINLGTSRLRTETAGILICHTVHLLNN